MKECFVIGPIDKEGTVIRKYADAVFKHVIQPVANACEYNVVRADKIHEPGIITIQIIKHLWSDADLVIADLTNQNPNVFYELGIRHAALKPYVQIIRKGEKIPFDLEGLRTIHFDLDPDSIEQAKNELFNHIKKAESGKEIDNPVSLAFIVRDVERGDRNAIADLMQIMSNRMESLANLAFDEKLAVMAGYRENTAKNKDVNIERVKNDFLAVSNLKKWANPKKREKLISDYVIPIIENVRKNKCIDYQKGIVLREIIEIALEYDIEQDKLREFNATLLECWKK